MFATLKACLILCPMISIWMRLTVACASIFQTLEGLIAVSVVCKSNLFPLSSVLEGRLLWSVPIQVLWLAVLVPAVWRKNFAGIAVGSRQDGVFHLTYVKGEFGRWDVEWSRRYGDSDRLELKFRFEDVRDGERLAHRLCMFEVPFSSWWWDCERDVVDSDQCRLSLWSVSRSDKRFIFDSILSSDAERVTSSPGIGIAACSAFLAASIVASSVAGACCKTYCLIVGFRPVLMGVAHGVIGENGFRAVDGGL